MGILKDKIATIRKEKERIKDQRLTDQLTNELTDCEIKFEIKPSDGFFTVLFNGIGIRIHDDGSTKPYYFHGDWYDFDSLMNLIANYLQER